MTHGDKSKAKKAASKASGKSSKAPLKAAKAAVKAGAKAVQSGKKGSSGSEKAAAAPKGSGVKAPAKENGRKAGPEPKAVAKADAGAVKGRPARPAVPGGAPGFNNPVVADAFKRAVKKYPNAFRRLTD